MDGPLIIFELNTTSNKKDIEANDPATSITLITELRLYDTLLINNQVEYSIGHILIQMS